MEETRIIISADPEVSYSTLNEVFESGNVHAGDTITCLSNVVVDSVVTIGKRCTLDLNGHSLFVSVPSAIIIKNGVTVDIINGNISSFYEQGVEDLIIVQGSKTSLILRETVNVKNCGTAIHAKKRGGVVIDGATIQVSNVEPAVIVEDPSSTVVMNSGVLSSLGDAVSVINEGSFVVNGGQVINNYVEKSEEVVDSEVPVETDSEDETEAFIEPAVEEIHEESSQEVEDDSENSTDVSSEISEDSPKENSSEIFNDSVNVTRPIQLYKTPSRKYVLANWTGALTLASKAHFLNVTGDEYFLVKFKIPGSGCVSSGFAIVEEILKFVKEV